jgi:hypothetical protein
LITRKNRIVGVGLRVSGDMGFLSWIKNYRQTKGQPEPPAPNWKQTLTRRMNPIVTEYTGAWQITRADGRSRFRHHVGRSVEGFHGGIEISLKEGFSTLKWSNARPEIARAEKASAGMERAWEMKCADIEKAVDAEFRIAQHPKTIRGQAWER